MLGDLLPVGWPAAAAIGAGVGTVTLGVYLRPHRGKPGVDWFFGVFLAQAVWCFSYGVSLFVFDPSVRVIFEMVTWLGIVWTGITFLGFALEYTGRSEVVRGWLFRGLVAFGALTSLLVITNGLHGLVWTEFGLAPVYGTATVSYAFGPWAYLTGGIGTIAVASAVFLLVDTFFSYGPLYRRETTAVALSALPPGFALLAWLFELGPVPQLNLAPVLFVPHVVLDAYAFGRAEMFERNPATVRAAERTAIDDLGDPVVVLTTDRRILRLNRAAERMLDVTEDWARDRPLADLLGVDIPLEDDPDPIPAGPHGHRTYTVSPSRLTDPNGMHLGYTVVFSDVTERERRRQQLEVLNRILRHNLRNDATVVHGNGQVLADRLDDPGLHKLADAIERRAGALATLGEKASTVESLFGEEKPGTVSLGRVVEETATQYRSECPGATIDVVVEEDVTATVRTTALRALVENAVENALHHHDGEGTERADGGPWVRVRVRRVRGNGAGNGEGTGHGDSTGTAVITVADDGPGIPDHEVETVESGRETALEHGSGLGLWIIEWAAGRLGASVQYEDRDPRGTTVTVRLPLPDEGAQT